MLQEGLALMQNKVYEAYTLKASSNIFTWDKGVGLLLGL